MNVFEWGILAFQICLDHSINNIMILNEVHKGAPHHESSQKLMLQPFPKTILVLEVTQSISLLILLQIEEAMWYIIGIPSPSTQVLNKIS